MAFFQRSELPTGEYYISPFAKVLWSVTGAFVLLWGTQGMYELITQPGIGIDENKELMPLVLVISGAAALFIAPYAKRSPASFDLY